MTKISILFYLFLLPVFAFSQGDSSQTPIKDLFLKEKNEDLQFLDKAIEDVQVLAIGESTHGTKEFNLMYLKMFKYLVEEHNFTTLFLEDEYSRCLGLDRYVKCKENCESVSAENLGKWPWMTSEMNDLIEWIKNHNGSTNKAQLSIVGIDIQDSQHTCLTLNKILKSSNQDTLLLPSLERSSTEKQYTRQIKKFTTDEAIEFYEGKVNRIENSSRTVYSKLIEVLEWNKLMIKKPRKSIRDLAMGKNILSYLKSFPDAKGMLIAHNDHVAKISDGKKKEIKNNAFIGGVVQEVIGEKYFAIMQEFDEGCFNAYSLISKKKTKEIGTLNTKNYDLGKVCVEKSVEHSIGSILRNKATEILYITEKDFFDLTPVKDIRYHSIGGLFVAAKKNVKQTRQFYILRREGWYDGIIFHRQSTPTTLLKN